MITIVDGRKEILFTQERGYMLIYTELLCAIVVVAYLVQFQLYNHSRSDTLGTDIFDIIGLPIESELFFASLCRRTAVKITIPSHHG
jgi:hypothetical protein